MHMYPPIFGLVAPSAAAQLAPNFHMIILMIFTLHKIIEGCVCLMEEENACKICDKKI